MRWEYFDEQLKVLTVCLDYAQLHDLCDHSICSFRNDKALNTRVRLLSTLDLLRTLIGPITNEGLFRRAMKI